MTLLSVRQAAHLLHVDPRTLKRSILDGRCPVIQLGSRFKIEAGALQRWAAGTPLPTLEDEALDALTNAVVIGHLPDLDVELRDDR